MTRKLELTPEDFKTAKGLADDLRQKLPKEFTLTGQLTRNGERRFPDLNFKADPKIPGLFSAEVDPNCIMTHTREPAIKIKKGKE